MKTQGFLVWLVLSAAMLFAGCTEQQLASADRAVADANRVAQAAKETAQGPAGPLIPVEGRAVLELIGILGAVGFTTWQQIRGKLLKRTAAAIVQAVEQLPPEIAGPVKDEVKVQMLSREIYTRANPIVDQLKGVA